MIFLLRTLTAVLLGSVFLIISYVFQGATKEQGQSCYGTEGRSVLDTILGSK